MSARLAGATVLALARSGLAGQLRPRHVPALARAVRETGFSLATLIAVAAVHRPDTPAVIDERGTVTYAELDDASARVAAGIAASHGDTRSVAVLCRNHRGFVLATTAAARLGADVLFLNTEFSAPQLAVVLTKMRPGVIVADEEFLPTLGDTDIPVVLAWHDDTTAKTSLDELVATNSRHRPRRRPKAGKLTILTSGTTGAPKGAPRAPSPLVFLSPLVTILRRTPLRSGDAVLIGVPLFHGFGLAVWGLTAFLRSPVILRRRFTPQDALADATRHRAATIAVVPVMLQRILALPEPEHDLRQVHSVLSGAAPLRPELAEKFQDTYGDVLYNGYGSSEVGIAAVATPADLRAAPGTVGEPCIGTPVRVLDKAGREVPTGEQGVIHVGGHGVFTGYTGGGTKDVTDGLMSTGDVGHFDAEGRLFVDGRADDMIVSGGENVYPGEVEDVLARHPGVADVAVLGVDDPEYGQRLIAYVVPDGAAPSQETLAAYVKSTLARYKVPREFVFLDHLPRNATGKLLRRDLSKE